MMRRSALHFQAAKKAGVVLTLTSPSRRAGSGDVASPDTNHMTQGASQAEHQYKVTAAAAFYSSLYYPLNSTGRRVTDAAEKSSLISLAMKEQFVSPLWLSAAYLSSVEAGSLRDHLSLGTQNLALPAAHYNTQQLSDSGSGLLSFGSDAHCLAAVMNSLRCAITGQRLIIAYGADAAAAVARVAIHRVLPYIVADPQDTPFKASIHHPSSAAWLYWAPETMMLEHYGGNARRRTGTDEDRFADFVLRGPPPPQQPQIVEYPNTNKDVYSTHPFLTRCFTDASLLLPDTSPSSDTLLTHPQHAVRFVCAGATGVSHACHPLAYQYKFAKNATYHQRQNICTRWNSTAESPSEWISVPMSPVLVTDCLRKFLTETGAANKRKSNNPKKTGDHAIEHAAFISAARRWCVATYHPSHYSDDRVAMACTTTSYVQGVGNGAVSLWSLFGTRKQFETLGSPVGASPTSSSNPSLTTVSLSSAIGGSMRSPVEEPVQHLDANGGASSLYCAAATAQPDRLLYLLKNRY